LGLQAGRLVRADLDGLALSLDGAALRGALWYDVAGRRLDARLGGDEVEAAGLVMRLAPGWLDAGDRLRLVGVRLTALALDPMTLETGTARLEARGLRWERPAGHLAGERFAAQLQFARAGATLALDVERV